MTAEHARFTGARHLPVFLLILMMTLFLSPTVTASVNPTKSPNDNNDYRFLELDNGLRVLLVSDPQSEKAAASVNVAVGSGDDPDDRAGLAHFLEHMLFLGTEKYPDAGEYQQFIRSHGGSHNAFTAFQDTNYFFDVEAEFLEPALDRFAQQFSAPLFTPELVDRERNAVHSEFTAKLKDDARRLLSVRKAGGNPDHAFSRFAVGNLTTLENTNDNPLRPDLIEFWQQHYSANIMTLAVYGPQSLDELERMVRPRFSAVENRHLSPKTHPQPVLDVDRLPEKITAESLKDSRHMTLAFPIPSQKANYKTKPVSYLANLIGHEGEGSLFDVLKKAGLAHSLSAGLGMDTGEHATLEISLSLTREGLQRQDEIIALTFEYLDKIRENGIREERFREMQQLATIDFRYREKAKPVSEAMRLSRMLRDYPAEDVLSAPWLMERYAPDQYRALLEQLTPDNLLVRVSEPTPQLDNPMLTRWYQTPWQREPLATLADGNQQLASQLTLPEMNPFVPEDLSLVTGKTMEQPLHLAELSGLDVWYARDTRFNTPKANVLVSLRTPAATGSAREKVLTQMLLDVINQGLNAQTYAARLAGLDYRVYGHLRGITVRVGGYNDKLHTLLGDVLAEVANPTLTEQRFALAHQRLIDNLENKAKNRPVQQTSEFVQTRIIEGTFPTEDKLAVARKLSLQDLQEFADGLLTQTDPVMLAHGNLTEAAALNLAKRVEAQVLTQGERTSVARAGIRTLPAGQTKAELDINHPDTGYTLYLQGDNTSYQERARYRLLAQMIGSPFYEEIRTTRQLGYIVYATNFEILETPALALVVQSPEASSETIDQAVSDFANAYADELAALGPQRLEREKQAVISRLLEPEHQLGEISTRYWREIDRENNNFDSRERLAEAIREVSLEALIETFEKALLKRERALLVTTP